MRQLAWSAIAIIAAFCCALAVAQDAGVPPSKDPDDGSELSQSALLKGIPHDPEDAERIYLVAKRGLETLKALASKDDKFRLYGFEAKEEIERARLEPPISDRFVSLANLMRFDPQQGVPESIISPEPGRARVYFPVSARLPGAAAGPAWSFVRSSVGVGRARDGSWELFALGAPRWARYIAAARDAEDPGRPSAGFTVVRIPGLGVELLSMPGTDRLRPLRKAPEIALRGEGDTKWASARVVFAELARHAQKAAGRLHGPQ